MTRRELDAMVGIDELELGDEELDEQLTELVFLSTVNPAERDAAERDEAEELGVALRDYWLYSGACQNDFRDVAS